MTERFANLGVKFAYIFGSRARGQDRPDSDLDVAVWYAPELDCMERFQRNCQLQESLKQEFGTAVDLIILNDAKPTLQNEAVLRGKAIYPEDDPEAIIRFEARIRQHHEDYAYSQRFFTQARRARMAHE